MRKVLRGFMNILHKICVVFGYIGNVLIAVLMLLVVVDVFLRQVFNVSILGAYEMAQLLLLSIAYTSFAYGQMKKSHIHVTMFIQMLPEKACMFAFAATSILSVIICGFMAVASFVMGKEAYIAGTTSWARLIPYWPFYYLMGVCMILLVIVMIEDTITAFKGISDPELAKEIRSTWL